MIKITSNIDAVIARLQALKKRGVDQAIEAACTSPRWRAGALKVARATLEGLTTQAERGWIEGILQTFAHESSARGFAFELSGPAGVLSSARALLRQMYVSEHGGHEHLRQRPPMPTRQFDDEVSELRDRVRQWVIDEKEMRPEDAKYNYDPDVITDRLMHIMGLEGGKMNWAGILAPKDPDEPAGSQVRAPGIGRQDTAGASLARAIEDSLTFAVPPDEQPKAHDLLVAVGVAWRQMVLDELPRMVIWQVRKQWHATQGTLFATPA